MEGYPIRVSETWNPITFFHLINYFQKPSLCITLAQVHVQQNEFTKSCKAKKQKEKKENGWSIYRDGQLEIAKPIFEFVRINIHEPFLFLKIEVALFER